MVLIILFFLFVFVTPTHGFSSYKNNPIINESDGQPSIQPFVTYNNGEYILLYAKYTNEGYKIIQAKSTNGIDWFDSTMLALSNQTNVHDPSVLYENNQYHYYFASSHGGRISLWKNQAKNSTELVPNNAQEILTSLESWEGNSLSCPAIFKENGTMYLFYAGNGISNWSVGLAYLDEQGKWSRCKNNPLIQEAASAQLVKTNNGYYLYFQSPNGLESMYAKEWNGCSTQWSHRQIIPSLLRDPAPLFINNSIYVYGTDVSTYPLTIGLGSEHDIPIPTYPVVLIPGLFASWNKDAILHNSVVDQSSWKLNSAVSEYNALKEAFKTVGAESQFFMFPYDWRKPVEQIADQLNLYLNESIWKSNKYQPIHIVGHSLGGLVGRVYESGYKEKRIKKLITVGTPHLGAPSAYKTLVSGDIERENTIMWLAQKLILNLNRSGLQTDKQVVRSYLPVLYDLLPSFPFLKTQQNELITPSKLINQLVIKYPIQTDAVRFLHMGGSGFDTKAGFIIGERNALDVLLDIYEDGHILSSFIDDGDKTVLKTSSHTEELSIPQLNHGQIIYEKNQVKKILHETGYEIAIDAITEGKQTIISPSLLFFLRSPAAMKVYKENTVFEEKDGMIYIQNAEDGIYNAHITGADSGSYTFHAWLIRDTDDQWFTFTKETKKGQKNSYEIVFSHIKEGSVKELISITPTPTQTTSSSTITSSSSTSTTTSSPSTTSPPLQSKSFESFTDSKTHNFIATHKPSSHQLSDISSNTAILGTQTQKDRIGNNTLQKQSKPYTKIAIYLFVLILIGISFWKRKNIIQIVRLFLSLFDRV